MKEYQRKQLLERVNREGATVGTRIPERITVCGEPLELRAFVFEIKRRETVPPGERDRVEAAKRNLRRERRRRLDLIESGDVDLETAEEAAQAVIGIDRALNALERLGPTDLEAEAAARETADTERWLSFLKQALGRDRGRGRRSR